jgi:hypothetical protein|tara:strand:- start:538 stop:1107 length:570 start_codon:yes stop_codon:yes gene_type:complete
MNLSNLIKTLKGEINELDQRFSLVLENFVPNYILYLKNPNNKTYIEEKDHVFNTIEDINSSSFLLMNDMHNKIEKENASTRKLNLEMDNLKKENELMKNKLKGLKRQAITSEGMFEDLLDWYKEQLLVIIVMIIGVMLGTYFMKTLNMDIKQWVISLGIVLVFGFIFTQIAIWVINKWSTIGNKMDNIQ